MTPGSSHSANVATFRSMDRGLATSATLMVPCPWAREAARMFQGFPIGVHLTLTSEYPRYRWRGLTEGASLHDMDGFFPARTKIALEHLTAKDAGNECRAQLETALSWGIDVIHIDDHMDVPRGRPDLFEVFLEPAHVRRRRLYFLRLIK